MQLISQFNSCNFSIVQLYCIRGYRYLVLMLVFIKEPIILDDFQKAIEKGGKLVRKINRL